jgi:glycerol-3-phosphate O-acyltransferase
MSSQSFRIGPLAFIKLRFLGMLEWVLHLWVRTRNLPDPLSDLGIKAEHPVCYAVDIYALSTMLILDNSCRNVGLPRPFTPLALHSGQLARSYCALQRREGLLIQRKSTRKHSEMLKHLVDRVCSGNEPEIQIVPVTVLVGRAPDTETGLAKIFFSESWEVGGRFRRLFSTMVNGRNTFVQYGKPISLRKLADENLGEARTLRKVSRILRVKLAQSRTAAIGPDLSHRRTVIDGLLLSPTVEKAIDDQARADKTSTYKAWKKARKFAYEIAADYSYAFVRMASLALSWFWNQIYDGVDIKHFRELNEVAPDHTVIYVPCHRSHIDYLLLSYVLYHQGLVPPHVAAGVNLNLPLVGRLVRKGGGFYLRRSFRSQKLYAAVFNEYLSSILAQGTSVEYFIEGTRSRTGRLLHPKAGMLSMTVRSYLRAPARPIVFQPVYIGYERLVEGKSYTAELSGAEKKTESLLDLFKVFGILRKRYGRVHVSFAEPILLDQLLEQHDPAWREQTGQESKPAFFNALVDQLGTQIMTGMNQAAHVNAINLLAVVLLATPKHALGRNELQGQLDLYLGLLESCRYSNRIAYSAKSSAEIIEYGVEMGILEIREHPLGEIIAVKPEEAVLLTYFRNNVSHLLALPSLVAACFLNARRIERERLERIATALYPFLKNELFLPWDDEGFRQALQSTILWMQQRGLLVESREEGLLERADGSTDFASQLQILGNALLQTFERYYITVAVLAKNGSGVLSRAQLERLCTLAAQRINQLSKFDAPEFYDRNLFRQFIDLLRQLEVLSVNEAGKLEFNETIASITEDAKTLLSKDIRHGIIRVAPQVLQEADSD